MHHSQQIRRAFLKYFEEKKHRIVPSSPVIPHDDPTLLFINAGMNQFKDVFLGKSTRDYARAATSQKCIRVGGKHNDLENVGHTSRHLTFFEMLGNFSFGDYFKKEAIHFAWEVSTEIFGYDPEKIWVSVFEEDEEAFELWQKHIPIQRIVRFGESENFWSMGEVGPCGPCSELLYDRGEKFGGFTNPTQDLTGERFLEFWNLVFMQFEKETPEKIVPLPKKSVDTGAGIERVVSLKMGVENVFQTDILRALIRKVEELTSISYNPHDTKLAAAFHVIADHIRSLSFALADGVQPSNTDRGYVLRKILRRAVRYGKMLRLEKPFLGDVFLSLLKYMGEDFPELKQAKDRILEVLELEEASFFRTLIRGGNLLNQVIAKSKGQISGDDAFKLKDTYGFPLEEVLLIAKDENLKVDLARYRDLEEEAKEKSRASQKSAVDRFDANFFANFANTHKSSHFIGYEKEEIPAEILAIVAGEQFVHTLEEGQTAFLILNHTPFYAEMGGQVGDQGEIFTDKGHFTVHDTSSPFPGVICHIGELTSGSLKKGERVTARIDTARRKKIQNNHTATHILHWALEKVLGSHIKQAGSLVEAKRLRFDFNHHKSLSSHELLQIEKLVNDKIRSDTKVKSYELQFSEIQGKQDIKQFFGDKYGDKVRVIDLNFSKELCGGTHTSHVGTIGLFKIVKEGSIAAGVRRIEAVSGIEAEELVQKDQLLLQALADKLKCKREELEERLADLVESKKLLESDLLEFQKKEMRKLVESAMEKKELLGEIPLIAMEASLPFKVLSEFAESLAHSLKSGVVVVSAKENDKCQLIIRVSSDLVKKNIAAHHLIQEAAPFIQGGGGGKAHFAQAGGKDPKGLPQAFEKIRLSLKNLS